MIKSNKRMKLEQEIFSTSIQDIEQMFASPLTEDQSEIRPRKVSSCSTTSQIIDALAQNLPFKTPLPASSNKLPFDLSAFYYPNQGPLRYEGASSTLPPSHTKHNHNRLDLPAGTCLGDTKYDYDCINMSLLSEAQSESSFHTAHQGPSSNYMAHARTASKDYVVVSQNVLFNLNEELLDDYMYELDLKLYSPRVNLESDLKMIDILITRPLSMVN